MSPSIFYPILCLPLLLLTSSPHTEEEFSGSIFCSASDGDLDKLDPSLKHGPKIQLRTLRDKLKKIISEVCVTSLGGNV